MRGPLTASTTVLLVGCLVLSGCASAADEGPALGPARVFEGDSTERLSWLALPLDSELWIEPGDVVVRRAEAGAERVRLQVVVRALRHDGGVVQWLPAAAEGAAAGEGGRSITLGAEEVATPLAPARLGPLQVRHLAALEVLVALLPVDVHGPVSAHAYVGAARVEATPAPSRSSEGALGRIAAAARDAGATALLAGRLPLAPEPEAAPGVTSRALRWTAAGAAGTATLHLGLRTELSDHTHPDAPAGGVQRPRADAP